MFDDGYGLGFKNGSVGKSPDIAIVDANGNNKILHFYNGILVRVEDI